MGLSKRDQAHIERRLVATLTDACETLGSATVMLNDFAALLEGSHRKTAQGIAQVVMVAEMAVNQVLDKLVPTD